ncbi:hypothetical protein [Nonomuraea sp. NPDC001831]
MRAEIGFGISRLLNVDLLPRINQISHVRLYQAESGEPPASAAWRRR